MSVNPFYVLHRSGVTAADGKLAIPADPTLAVVADTGSLLSATTYNVALAASNSYGTTPASGIVAQGTGGAGDNETIRVTTTIVAGATHYDVFLSVDAAPKWVARVTEAQRLAGCTVTAVGTVIATSPGANKIDVRVTGTGLATSATAFALNTAFTPATLTPVESKGFGTARLLVSLTVDRYDVAPSLALLPFVRSNYDATKFYAGALTTLTFVAGAGQSLQRYVSLDLDGADALEVFVDSIAGTGATADIVVELS